jgi:hypothetical protein
MVPKHRVLCGSMDRNSKRDLQYSLRRLGAPDEVTLDEEGAEEITDLEVDRPRGILTPDDREFLIRGSDERSKRASDGKRTRIRSRVRNTILDFYILELSLTDEDREAIISPSKKVRESTEELAISHISQLKFAMEGIEESEFDLDEIIAEVKEEVEQGEE